MDSVSLHGVGWYVPEEPTTQLAVRSLLGKREFPCCACSAFSVNIS